MRTLDEPTEPASRDRVETAGDDAESRRPEERREQGNGKGRRQRQGQRQRQRQRQRGNGNGKGDGKGTAAIELRGGRREPAAAVR